MVENDHFIYHVKRPLIDKEIRVFHSLITEERTRKLELLTHLIANSKKSIVICGPEGIGKSTTLKVLQERNIDSWRYCLVQGNDDLCFEKIQEQTGLVIKRDEENPQPQAFSAVYKRTEGKHKKIVLMFDEAGYLGPGLINTIIEYAEKNPLLRVIFVLTHDELYEKNSSDNTIDDCHLIEIPPLSEKQCGDFLQYLVTKPHSQIAFSEISDELIESIYHETQGIPGRIITGLPTFEDIKQNDNSLRILIAAVTVLVVIALAVQWYSASAYNIKPISAPDSQKPDGIENGGTK